MESALANNPGAEINNIFRDRQNINTQNKSTQGNNL